jgi:DNA-nicking Smr family endonuclease
VKFQIGDKVLLLKTMEEGEIMNLLDSKTVEVKLGKIVIPVFMDEIDHPYFHWFTSKKGKVYYERMKTFSPQEDKKIGGTGMCLIFFPEYDEHDNFSKIRVHLMNDHPKFYEFEYTFRAKSGNTFSHKSDMAHYQNVYLHDITYEELATHPNFQLKFNGKEDISVAIKPKKLAEILQDMNDKGHVYFSHFLFNENICEPPIVQVKPITIPTIQPKPQKVQISFKAENHKSLNAEKLPHYLKNPNLVDLHANILLEDFDQLQADVIQDRQIEAFLVSLDHAYKLGLEHFTVIHGVGNGKLKNRIHRHLDQTKLVLHYVHEFSAMYGMGATQIFLRK